MPDRRSEPHRREAVSVSSFCLWTRLGGARFELEDESGHPMVFELAGEGGDQLPLEAFPGVVAQWGVTSIDLCQVQLLVAPAGTIQRLEVALHDSQVEVMCLHVDLGNLASTHDGRRRASVVAHEPWITAAARLGARYIRVNMGVPRTAPEPDGALISSLSELADRARDNGLGLLVENKGGVTSDPDWLTALLEDVGRDRLGLVLDTGAIEPMASMSGARWAGHPLDEGSIDLSELYRVLARLAPLATLVDAKAYDLLPDGSFGPLDIPLALETVRAHGYSGVVTVEYEGRAGNPWEATRRAVDLVHAVWTP
jgi:sugar phosphate isomerase/epimerase